MKSTLLGCILLFSLGFNARAQYEVLFDSGNVAIPDYDANGYQETRTITGLSGSITDLNVTLSISGGFNGDLYAWLSHDSGLSILLNRVGRSSTSELGYGDTGFGTDAFSVAFTLDDQALQDVHFYQAGSFTLNFNGQLTGSWQPDGRILDPESPAASFDSASRLNLLDSFNGLDPNGGWTLFVADTSPTDVSTLVGWGLQISVVPEPSASGLFGLGAVTLLAFRRRTACRTEM